MTKVKICGITEPAHALTAAQAGADFIGLVFAPSSRRLCPERARQIATAVKGLAGHPQLVGVFVNTPTREVNHITRYCSLDWVQLSGDEPWEDLHSIDRPVIRAIRVHSQQHGEEIIDAIRRGREEFGDRFVPLLDCHVAGSYGGSGRSFDWRLAGPVCRHFPVIIAGGLSPHNVAKAMIMARPWGVDVSSGVETSGAKDPGKIIKFIEAVRNEDDR